MALSVAVFWGCNGSPPTDSEPLDGAALVAGTSIPRHGLLIVPRAGGTAELRAFDDPSRIRWTGSVELPPSTSAHPLGRAVVIRGEDGTVHVFRPSGELLREAGEVPPEARWVETGGGGAFIWGSNALIVTAEGERLLGAPGPVVWAAAASGGRSLVLSGSGSDMTLELWEPEAEEASVSRSVSPSGPVVLAGYGREVLLAEGEEGRLLVERSIPDLEPVERARLDRTPAVLAVSPSQHRLFVAPRGEGRIEALDRYGWEEVTRADLDGTIRDLRPSITGESVLAFDGSAAWVVEAGESDAIRIDTDWRPDLPLALPDDRVLTVSGGAMRSVSIDGDDAADVDGPADAWWLPVRWTPRGATPVVRPPATDSPAVDDPESETQAQPLSVGLTTVGRIAGRALAEARPAPRTDAPGAAPAAPGPGGDSFAVVPDGFYAVATSSRQLQSLGALRSSLEGSGYATEVLTRRDEADDLWYRLLVGPYRSRAEAESAARDLRRERGISAWIHEAIGGSTGGPG